MDTLSLFQTALLVVDVQCAFDEWEATGLRRNNPDALARIVDLLSTFRAKDMPIYHIRHEGSRPNSLFKRDAPGFAVRDEVRELPGETVVVKRVNSAFIGTGLNDLLHSAAVRTLVICGATTNHCVETTARMAGNLGFDAILVRDATWTFDQIGPDGDEHSAEAIHAMTLTNLNGEFARIATAAEIVTGLNAGMAATSDVATTRWSDRITSPGFEMKSAHVAGDRSSVDD